MTGLASKDYESSKGDEILFGWGRGEKRHLGGCEPV